MGVWVSLRIPLLAPTQTCAILCMGNTWDSHTDHLAASGTIDPRPATSCPWANLWTALGSQEGIMQAHRANHRIVVLILLVTMMSLAGITT